MCSRMGGCVLKMAFIPSKWFIVTSTSSEGSLHNKNWYFTAIVIKSNSLSMLASLSRITDECAICSKNWRSPWRVILNSQEGNIDKWENLAHFLWLKKFIQKGLAQHDGHNVTQYFGALLVTNVLCLNVQRMLLCKITILLPEVSVPECTPFRHPCSGKGTALPENSSFLGLIELKCRCTKLC